MMNKKIWGQNVNSRRVRESVTSERPHGAEPDRASRNYHRLTIPKMYPNLPRKKKESFCHGLSDYLVSTDWVVTYSLTSCRRKRDKSKSQVSSWLNEGWLKVKIIIVLNVRVRHKLLQMWLLYSNLLIMDLTTKTNSRWGLILVWFWRNRRSSHLP